MAFGNKIGVKLYNNVTNDMLFYAPMGSIVLETRNEVPGGIVIGETVNVPVIEACGVGISRDEAIEAWTGTLEKVYPTHAGDFKEARETKGQPTAIIAQTVKGKGASFMENQVGWHGVGPNDEQCKAALEELEKAGEA